MPRLAVLFSVITAFVLVLTGCGPRGNDTDVDPDGDYVEEGLPHSMPAERQDTLVVEGQSEPVTLRLFETPESPVLIYYPEGDFSPTEVGSGQAYGVHFIATFGGVRNDNAWIRYFFPTLGSRLNNVEALQSLIEEEDGIADIEGFAVSRIEGSGRCPGDGVAWSIVSDTVTGGICIGSREDRYFLLISSYPLEYGDGFAPREALMRRHTYWRDTEESVFP